MVKIIISGCLLGEKCRYNGEKAKPEVLEQMQAIILKISKEYEMVSACPEVMGGLPIPRVPAEINGEKVINEKGEDVTKEYITGAAKVVKIAKEEKVVMAILKDGSPSCGSTEIYDGSFAKRKIKGEGITTKELRKNGIKVFSENAEKEILNMLSMLENEK